MSVMLMKASDEIKQTVIVVDDDKPIKSRQFNHFSHRHPLQADNAVANDVCSGCEHEVSGPAYVCTKPKCEFLLHDICFDLPRTLRHGSHPNHPLFLLHSPPDKESKCGACGDSMHAFTYHCEACRFSLHVECASLPEFEIRRDHVHPLMLLWNVPPAADQLVCYVCDYDVDNGCWMYSCLACKCGVHLDCIAANP